jgi:pre-rRNA-processing protein TSR3
MATYPPTIIVVHRKERREKCSVEPLRRRDRDDFVFWRYPFRRLPKCRAVQHHQPTLSAVVDSDYSGAVTQPLWPEPFRDRVPPLAGYVRLGLGGPVLSRGEAAGGLLVLDGTWRLVQPMERQFAHVPIRSLPEWKTAYPRSSKTFADPQGGLATIEAIYLAYTILERDTSGLLNDYYWADEFLALNGVVQPTGR